VRSRQLGEAARRRLETAQAVTSERTRIARELHDVITHHVTAMVMRAGAAQYLPAGDVGGELGEIASTGRQALADLRSMLNLLDTAGADEQPTFAAGRLRDLVEATRQAGQPVSLIETGVAVELDGAAALAAYRVVQESLTNAQARFWRRDCGAGQILRWRDGDRRDDRRAGDRGLHAGARAQRAARARRGVRRVVRGERRSWRRIRRPRPAAGRAGGFGNTGARQCLTTVLPLRSGCSSPTTSR
jgi:hypothetical protein